MVVAAEMIAGNAGLGFAIWDARNGLRMDLLVCGMIVIGVVRKDDASQSLFAIHQALVRESRLHGSPAHGLPARQSFPLAADGREHSVGVAPCQRSEGAEASSRQFYRASSGQTVGDVEAHLNRKSSMVRSLLISPPINGKAAIQIGRFMFDYRVSS